MKLSRLYMIAAGLVGLILLNACQIPVTPSAAPASLPTQTPSPIPLPKDPTVEATAAPSILPTASPTPDMPDEPAVKTVQDYFSALENKDYQAAADLYSTFSLTVDNLTRGDGADELHSLMETGTSWSELQVQGTQDFDEKTVLVHVTYLLTAPDGETGEKLPVQKDELWPVRKENNRWLYNRANLIDFRTLSVSDQSTAGLRIKPLQLLRYSDHIRMVMLVQNTTNDIIVLGQSNEIMAAFVFGDRQVEAEKEQLVFQRLRTYPGVIIDVNGLFTDYPDAVIIRQWKNLQVAPWFTFQLNQ